MLSNEKNKIVVAKEEPYRSDNLSYINEGDSLNVMLKREQILKRMRSCC
jgi:hypothetical protein